MSGNEVCVLDGLSEQDTIVTDGSFSVRAKRERQGLRPSMPQRTSDRVDVTPSAPQASASVQTARVAVSEQGFEPAKVTLRAGVPAKITFVRTTDKTCGTEIVFPTLSIRRALPLNRPVDVEFTPAEAEDIAFACGMDMLRGRVVVE